MPLDRVRLTAAKYSLGRYRKLRLARPQGSGSTSMLDDGLHLARPQGSDIASASEDGLHLARPQGSDSASALKDDELRLARPQGSDSASALEDDGLRLARPQGSTQPRPRRNHHLAQTRVRTVHVARGAIITLPLASSGYGEQDRRPIRLTPVNK
jgi:hypothetical protein